MPMIRSCSINGNLTKPMQDMKNRKRRCPVMKENNKDCHFTKIDSLNSWAAVNLCAGDFEKCEIYKKWLKSHKTNLSPCMLGTIKNEKY